MKRSTLLLLLGLGLTAGAAPLRAQDNVTPPPKAPAAANAAQKQKAAADPFIQPPSSPPAVTERNTRAANIILEYDWIDVPRDEFAGLMKAKGVLPDASALRGELQTWIAQGKAKLVQLDLLVTRSGQRIVQQSVREIRYPTSPEKLQAPDVDAGGNNPLGFSMRMIGWSIEVEANASADGRTFELVSVPDWTDFMGDLGSAMAPAGAQSGDLLIPAVTRSRVTSGVSINADTWRLFWAGNVQVTQEAPALTRALFIRVAQVAVSSDQKPGPETTVTLETDWIDVSLPALNEWLFTRPLAEASTRLPEQVRAWIGEGKAKRRALDLTPTGSGQRAVGEALKEYIFPDRFRMLSDGRFVAAGEQTRNLGVTVEYEPVVGPEYGIAELNMIPQIIEHVGDLTYHRQQQGGRWVADVTQPVFYLMKFSTSLAVPLNTHSLLGTVTPPGATGAPDSGLKTIVLGRVHQ